MQEFEEEEWSDEDIKNLEGINIGGIFESKFAYVSSLGKDYDDGVVNMFKERDKALDIAIKALKKAEELNFDAMEAAHISPNFEEIDRSFNYEQDQKFTQAKKDLEGLQSVIKLESLLDAPTTEVVDSQSITKAINVIINEVAETDESLGENVETYRGSNYNFFRDKDTHTVVVEDVFKDSMIFHSQGDSVLQSDLSAEDVSIFLEYAQEIEQGITNEEKSKGFEIDI